MNYTKNIDQTNRIIQLIKQSFDSIDINATTLWCMSNSYQIILGLNYIRFHVY